jgi:hypothetical protein
LFEKFNNFDSNKFIIEEKTMSMKKNMKINKRKIKTRKIWTRSPAEQIVPKKRPEDEKFDDSLYRGQKITEEELDNIEDDFGRGFHD